MRRRRKRDANEINLTPLLDILFSILFIIMMAGRFNETDLKESHKEQLGKLEQEINGLKEIVNLSHNQMESYDKYHTEAVIITVTNVVREDRHYLVVKKGLDTETIEEIQLGNDKTDNVKLRIEEVIRNCVEITDNQPVYIVFYCDKENIYTIEYKAIVTTFNRLQENNKEVFFKVMEEER